MKLKSYRGNGVRVVYSIVRERDDAPSYRKMRSGTDAAQYVRDLQVAGLIPTDQEAFMVLALDSRHGVIGFQPVHVGTLDSAQVHPREVFRFAVATGAAALIVAHNHPSGDPTPSVEDRQITDRLQQAGELLGIEVLDHVVVGDGKFYSFADGRIHEVREAAA